MNHKLIQFVLVTVVMLEMTQAIYIRGDMHTLWRYTPYSHECYANYGPAHLLQDLAQMDTVISLLIDSVDYLVEGINAVVHPYPVLRALLGGEAEHSLSCTLYIPELQAF